MLTVTECEKLSFYNSKTKNWFTSPSGYHYPAPIVPAGFECYAKFPNNNWEQYWYVRKV